MYFTNSALQTSENGEGVSEYVVTINHTGTGLSYTEILADIAVRQYS